MKTCVRHVKGEKTKESFAIERTCPHNDKDCPEFEEYQKRMRIRKEHMEAVIGEN